LASAFSMAAATVTASIISTAAMRSRSFRK
jgi:hypothetical protein